MGASAGHRSCQGISCAGCQLHALRGSQCPCQSSALPPPSPISGRPDGDWSAPQTTASLSRPRGCRSNAGRTLSTHTSPPRARLKLMASLWPLPCFVSTPPHAGPTADRQTQPAPLPSNQALFHTKKNPPALIAKSVCESRGRKYQVPLRRSDGQNWPGSAVLKLYVTLVKFISHSSLTVCFLNYLIINF